MSEINHFNRHNVAPHPLKGFFDFLGDQAVGSEGFIQGLPGQGIEGHAQDPGIDRGQGLQRDLWRHRLHLEIRHNTAAADLAEVEETLQNILKGTGTYVSELG